eukprot:182488-Rhodomonas_salina.2
MGYSVQKHHMPGGNYKVSRLSFPSQLTFAYGDTMCSVVSLYMCLYMLNTSKAADQISIETISKIMENSNRIFGNHLSTKSHCLFTVGEVMDYLNIKPSQHNLELKEVMGRISNTPADFCCDLCMDLTKLIDNIHDGECCTVTFKKHTISIGCKDGIMWFCDSLTGVYIAASRRDLTCHMKKKLSSHKEEYSAVILKLVTV